MRFTSQDLGRSCIKVDTVLQEDFETIKILVLGDCEENGLIHMYYGESVPEALDVINDRLVGLEEKDSIVADVLKFFQDYEPRLLESQL